VTEALTEPIDVLIQLQDLDCLIRDMRDPEMASQQERLGFALEDIQALERTRERLAGQVENQRLLQIYERMSRRFVRAIVPVEGRVCTGCRMSLPTSNPTRQADAATCDVCENCGRILYRR